MLRLAYKIWPIIISLVLIVLLSQTVCELNNNNCNRCFYNGIACASQTQYYKCRNGKISKDVLHDCPENQVCTHKLKKCVEKYKLAPACPLTKTTFCGVCAKSNPNNRVTNDRKISFACVGPNHYKICQDNMISNDITFNCPTATVCSMHAFEETDQICVSKYFVKTRNSSASCLESPKLLPIELEMACFQYESRANVICFNIPNPYDFECESYIHCSRDGGHLQGHIQKCEQGFYDVLKNKCIKERPSMCGETKDVPLAGATSPSADALSIDTSLSNATSLKDASSTDSSLATTSLTDSSLKTSAFEKPLEKNESKSIEASESSNFQKLFDIKNLVVGLS